MSPFVQVNMSSPSKIALCDIESHLFVYYYELEK